MTEIHVKHFTKTPHLVTAVVWTGDSDEGKLLQAHKWVDGMDSGFSADKGGPAVLRGLVAGQVAFPGDIIVREEDGNVQVYSVAVFTRLFEIQGDAEVLSDGNEPRSPILDSNVPTGHNPEAVNLEPDPAEINRLVMVDKLRELAAFADDGDERSEDQLSEMLKKSGWDPDSDESETWAVMVEKVIDSGITIEAVDDEPADS